MRKLLLGFLLAFVISAIFAAIIFITTAFLNFKLIMSLYPLSLINPAMRSIFAAFFRGNELAATVIFSSIVTTTLSYIILKVLQQQQKLKLKALFKILRSFILATLISVITYHYL